MGTGQCWLVWIKCFAEFRGRSL